MKTTTENPLLSQAEELCEQRNVRLTPQRQEVLRLMSQQNGAISAYDLLDLLRQSEPQAKPPTVYRALDFLLEQGFVHRVESTNSFSTVPSFRGTFPCFRFLYLRPLRSGDRADHAGHRRNFTTYGVAATGFTLSHNVVDVQACQHPDACEHDHSVAIKKR
ncbi:MAG: zinc uptake transcriptional repressor Zur [Sodalis sp. (in: enterobacteria)]|uniref:zinc uptake transcriptional repressor Zur n=1 Tax=Sodalis sp. (in: enterobacteria) TaxID=1898979 RepID=UPI003F323C0E